MSETNSELSTGEKVAIGFGLGALTAAATYMAYREAKSTAREIGGGLADMGSAIENGGASIRANGEALRSWGES